MRYWWAIPLGAAAALLITSRARAAQGAGAPVHLRPHSAEAIAVFERAAQAAGLPSEWARRPSLHNLMDDESSGWVGRPSYAFSNLIPGIHHTSQAHRWPTEIWAPLRAGRWEQFTERGVGRCAATGLGQMCRDKMDLFPDGRAGIGDPHNEAVAFLRYIRGRYGNPDVAYRFHRLPRCDDERDRYIRSLSGAERLSAVFELGCKHHEGY